MTNRRTNPPTKRAGTTCAQSGMLVTKLNAFRLKYVTRPKSRGPLIHSGFFGIHSFMLISSSSPSREHEDQNSESCTYEHDLAYVGKPAEDQDRPNRCHDNEDERVGEQVHDGPGWPSQSRSVTMGESADEPVYSHEKPSFRLCFSAAVSFGLRRIPVAKAMMGNTTRTNSR